MGPFPRTPKGRTHLIVAVDYFTKWVEAQALRTLEKKPTHDFVFSQIICRYGVPGVLVTDNGKQFDNSLFKDLCERMKIKHRFSSVNYPQSNGQVENANRIVKKIIKSRVTSKSGEWEDELPSILWAYRTTHRTATGETPFSLAYGTEAVIPVEIGMPTYRTTYTEEEENEQDLRVSLDVLTERRDKAAIRIAAHQQKAARFYDKKVKLRDFAPGDLVLRKLEGSQKREAQGKLAPNWEGPYRIHEVLRPGTYRIAELEGRIIPRTWNAQSLRKFYQ